MLKKYWRPCPGEVQVLLSIKQKFEFWGDRRLKRGKRPFCQWCMSALQCPNFKFQKSPFLTYSSGTCKLRVFGSYLYWSPFPCFFCTFQVTLWDYNRPIGNIREKDLALRLQQTEPKFRHYSSVKVGSSLGMTLITHFAHSNVHVLFPREQWSKLKLQWKSWLSPVTLCFFHPSMGSDTRKTWALVTWSSLGLSMYTQLHTGLATVQTCQGAWEGIRSCGKQNERVWDLIWGLEARQKE